METKQVTGVLIIAHGSRKREANQELHDLVDRIRNSTRNPIVEPSFLELAEPGIPEGGAQCVARGATRVLMIPYFLSAGVHIQEDLKTAQQELAEKFPHVEFRLAPALGPHALLDEIVRERIQKLEEASTRET